MKKFAVFGGFLGSGKTTTMMTLTRYLTDHGTNSAMISNDLGHGVDLADNRYACLCGCNASGMTDECICYQNENLADRLDEDYESGGEFIISDIPGFGVGAPEHVYHGMSEKYPGKYELAPFTALIEPKTVEMLRSGNTGDLRYIYDTQLVETDLIVLNKCDLIGDAEREAEISWLRENYPEAEVIAISAMTEEGIDTLAGYLLGEKASMRHVDIRYGGEEFMAAMGRMSEYCLQYHATVCCNDFDGNAYLGEIAEKVRLEILALNYSIPHLKLLAWDQEGNFGKVDLIGEIGRASCRERV